MTRKLIITLCLALTAMGMTAQKSVDARINEIRQAYANRINIMNNQPYDDIKMEQMTVSYNRMYPGSGLFQYNDTYYWTDDDNEDYMLKPLLYFVTRKYSMNHGMYRYYREYLLDVESGEPMFLLVTMQMGDDETTKQEFRFYFDKGRLIKQVPERIGPFADDALLVPDFRIDDNGRARAVIEEFNGIKETFNSLIPAVAW